MVSTKVDTFKKDANSVNNSLANITVNELQNKSSVQNNNFQLDYEHLALIWLVGVALLLIYILAVNIRFSFKIRRYGQSFISKPYWATGSTGMVTSKQGIKRRIKMITRFKKKPLFWTLLGIAFFAVLAIAGLTNSKANEQVKATQHKSTEKVAAATHKSDTTKKSENKNENKSENISEDKTNNNAAKQVEAPVATEQIPVKIGKADADLSDFVLKAEHAFAEMLYKIDNKDQVKSNNGTNFYLGRRITPYDTKEAVIAYFERYWSPEISQKMSNNLHPQVVNGKLYTIIGDPPFVVYDKNQVYVSKVEGNIITVSTKSHFDGGRDSEIILKIKVTNGNRQIIWRSMQDEWKIFYE